MRELSGAGEPPPLTCAVVVEELWRGSRPDESDAISSLVGGIQIAPLGAAEGELAGIWRREFASRGTTLSQADCLIAAAAVSAEARLATGNPRHFPMDELELEHWPAGA